MYNFLLELYHVMSECSMSDRGGGGSQKHKSDIIEMRRQALQFCYDWHTLV
jgi:hypothetical protein